MMPSQGLDNVSRSTDGAAGGLGQAYPANARSRTESFDRGCELQRTCKLAGLRSANIRMGLRLLGSPDRIELVGDLRRVTPAVCG